jgi:hypothetical protein
MEASIRGWIEGSLSRKVESTVELGSANASLEINSEISGAVPEDLTFYDLSPQSSPTL